MSKHSNDIAIIGMACRMPKAENYRQFWDNLLQEIDCISPITEERWSTGDTGRDGKSTSDDIPITKYNGMLERFDEFDAGFFNLSPREVNNMDPQQRLLLEETWHCIEDSGIGLKNLKDSPTSVYVGATGNDYNLITLTRGMDVDNYASLGSFECMMANRISHAFDLKGTSLTLDTACSSSLVALHEARKALVAKECDYAFAAGVCIAFHPWRFISFSKARMMNEDGKCNTFDKDAKGFVQGEGVAVLLLERLDTAVRDKHRIYGVIKGTAVNHCGNSLTIAAPKVEAQKELIVKAYKEAGLNPANTTYVEAHGTGTNLGDPIEIEALNQAFAEFTDKKNYCKIGSVKTNVGHTGSAAGLVGLVKVLLMMQHKKILKTLNLSTVNPIIDFAGSPFLPAVDTTDWERAEDKVKRLAGVSAFGFGGVNAHAIVEEWDDAAKVNYQNQKETKEDAYSFFLLSAKNKVSLERQLNSWKDFSATGEYQLLSLPQISKNLLTGREQFSVRCGVPVKQKEDLFKFLKGSLELSEGKAKVKTLYLGDISEIPQDFEELILQNSYCMTKLKEQLVLLHKINGKRKSGNTLIRSKISENVLLHKYLLVYSLTAVLYEAGIEWEEVICEKSGYLVGLVLTGAVAPEAMLGMLSGKNEVQLNRPFLPLYDSVNREMIMPVKVTDNYMDSLLGNYSLLQEDFETYFKKALVLHETQFTFKKYMEEWEKIGNSMGFSFLTFLNNNHLPPEVSPEEKLLFVLACTGSLVQLNKKWSLSTPGLSQVLLEIINLILDGVLKREELASYILKKGVTAKELSENMENRLLSRNNLDHYSYLMQELKACEVKRDIDWIDSLLHTVNESVPDYIKNTLSIDFSDKTTEILHIEAGGLERFLTALWLKGISLQWDKIYDLRNIPCSSLPVYEYNRQRYWLTEQKEQPHAAVLHPMLDSNISTIYEQQYKKLLTLEDFYLKDHVVGKKIILPGVAYLEMARAAGELASGERITRLKEINWLFPLEYKGKAIEVYIKLITDRKGLSYEIYTCPEGLNILHSQGKLEFGMAVEEAQTKADSEAKAIGQKLAGNETLEVKLPEWLEEAESNAKFTYSHRECYEMVFSGCIGFDYGKGFRATEKAWGVSNIGMEIVKLPVHLKQDFTAYGLHPAILDASLRTVTWVGGGDAYKQLIMHIPFSLGSLEILGDLTEVVYTIATLSEESKNKSTDIRKYNITVFSDKGKEILRIKEFMIRRLKNKEKTENKEHDRESNIKLYVPHQTEKEISNEEKTAFTGEDTILLLNCKKDRYGIREELKQATGNIIQVEFDTDYRKEGKKKYGINPLNEADFEKLLTDIPTDKAQKLGVIHWIELPGRTELTKTEEDIRGFLNQSLYVLLNFYKVATKRLEDKNIRYLCAFKEQGDMYLPLAQALSVFSKSILSDNRRFLFSVTGISESGDRETAWAVVRELMGKKTYEDAYVVYKDKVRLREELKELSINEGNRRIKKEGTYLITGAFGSLGRLTAHYLAEQYQAKLVLTLRKEPDSLQIEFVQNLIALGAQVKTLVCDFDSYVQVQHVIEEAKKTFGSIQGIFHLAGTTDLTPVSRADVDTYEKVLRPKVYGLYYLDEALKEEKLDFIAVYSSIAAVIGDYGKGNYSVANRFLDRFAGYRNRLMEKGLRNGRIISINWPVWQEGTMKTEGEEEKVYRGYYGFEYLDTDTGFQILETVLAADADQVTVVCGSQERLLKQWNTYDKKVPSENLNPSENMNECLEMAFDYLKKIIAKATGKKEEELQANVELEAYGIDSIMIMELNKLLEVDFSDISKTLFFEYRTIGELADYFTKEYKEKLEGLLLDKNNSNKGMEKSDIKQQSVLTMNVKDNPMVSRFAYSRENLYKQSSNWDVKEVFTQQTGEIQNIHTQNKEEIAIIGLAGRYPMADNLDEFWENLKAGKDCITEVPVTRWNHDIYYSPEKGKKNKVYCKWGGFINGVREFDPLFFGISPREAELMDPQERLFLQTVHETVEDAGYTRHTLRENKVGVFVGVMNGQYQLLGVEHLLKGRLMDVRTSYSSIANRVSYYFNFNGPSLAVDTMCSSSLTAIHLACQSIKSGECDTAVAGGVNIIIHPAKYVFLSEQKFGSSEGHCRAFGQGGDGYVPAEGIGAVLLKPLNLAIADGDHIYGVIKASKVNHGGKTNGYTVPNPSAQTELIQAALKESGIPPETIGYLEAHGTGTKLGDPIEVASLTKAYKSDSGKKQYCPIGSVKANMGHGESSAGIASLTKVLYQMKHRTIVPSILADTLNENINFKDSPFYIERKLASWNHQKEGVESAKQLPLRAGISSFGAGGTNAHLIVEEYLEEQSSEKGQAVKSIKGNTDNITQLRLEDNTLIVLSAASKDRLQVYAGRLANYLMLSQKGEIPGGEVIHQLLIFMEQELKISRKAVSIEESLFDYGIQPLDVMKLSSFIRETFQVNMLPSDICSYESIARIADFILLHTTEETYRYDDSRLRDIAYTLQTGREALQYRMAFVAGSVKELLNCLQEFEKDGLAKGLDYGCVRSAVPSGNTESFKAKQAVIAKDYKKLAEFWVSGEVINWKELYDKEKLPHKISLATYPFLQEEYWISEVRDTLPGKTGEQSPFIDKLAYDISMGEGVGFVKTFQQEDYIVREHVVKGRTIIPGVVQLEMALEGFSQLTDKIFEAVQIEWLRPLEVLEERQVFVIYQQRQEGAVYEIKAYDAAGNGVLYSRGKLVFVNSLEPEDMINLERITDTNWERMESDRIYQSFLREGIAYGPYYQKISSLQVGKDNMLVRLKGEDNYQEGNYFLCSPNAIDAALQSLSAFVGNLGTGLTKTNVPYSVGKVKLLSPHEEIAWVFVEHTDNAFFIRLLNNKGKVCILLERVIIKEIKEEGDGLVDFFFRTVWKEETLSVSGRGQMFQTLQATGESLILYDRTARVLAESIANILPGKKNSHEIKEGSREEFRELLKNTENIISIYYIDYLPDVIAKDSIDNTCYGFHTLQLFRLLKELTETGCHTKYLEFKVITFDVADKHNYRSAGLAGMMTSLDAEHKKWNVNVIDVLSEDVFRYPKETAQALIEETGSQERQWIHLAEGKRYIRQIEPLSLSATGKNLLRKQGVYVLLGGGKGIGYEVSRHLAKEYQASVIWVGRSSLDDRMQAKISEINSLGGHAAYYRADARKEEDLTEAIRCIREEYGVIHGVFHTAVVLADGMLYNMEEAGFTEALESKVNTGIHLVKAFDNEVLDFMVFFSSVQSVYGNGGQSNYAAGCTFLDAYALHLNEETSYPVKVINWGYWGTVGAAATQKHNRLLEKQGFYPITIQEGIFALEQILVNEYPQVIALKKGTKTLEHMKKDRQKAEWYLPEVQIICTENERLADTTHYIGQEVGTVPKSLKTSVSTRDIGQMVENISKDILGIKRNSLDWDKPFMDYGVDSVNGLELVEAVNEHFQIVLKTTILFDYPNIRALAGYIKDELKVMIEVEPKGKEISTGMADPDDGERQELYLLEQLASGNVDINTILKIMGE